MKELQAAEDSMDELGSTTFAPGSSTELVFAKASSTKLISRTSTSIKKAYSVHEATQPTAALSPIPEEEAHLIGPLSAAERL